MEDLAGALGSIQQLYYSASNKEGFIWMGGWRILFFFDDEGISLLVGLLGILNVVKMVTEIEMVTEIVMVTVTVMDRSSREGHAVTPGDSPGIQTPILGRRNPVDGPRVGFGANSLTMALRPFWSRLASSPLISSPANHIESPTTKTKSLD